jgi:hypothetical protein
MAAGDAVVGEVGLRDRDRVVRPQPDNPGRALLDTEPVTVTFFLIHFKRCHAFSYFLFVMAHPTNHSGFENGLQLKSGCLRTRQASESGAILLT